MFHLSMRFSLTRRWSNVLFSRNDDEFHFILTFFYFWTGRNSSILGVRFRNVRLKLETSYTRINCKLKYISAIQQMYSKMAMERIEKVHAFPSLSRSISLLFIRYNERKGYEFMRNNLSNKHFLVFSFFFFSVFCFLFLVRVNEYTNHSSRT